MFTQHFSSEPCPCQWPLECCKQLLLSGPDRLLITEGDSAYMLSSHSLPLASPLYNLFLNDAGGEKALCLLLLCWSTLPVATLASQQINLIGKQLLFVWRTNRFATECKIFLIIINVEHSVVYFLQFLGRKRRQARVLGGYSSSNKIKSYYLIMTFFFFFKQAFCSKIKVFREWWWFRFRKPYGHDNCWSFSLKYDNSAIPLCSMIKGLPLARVTAASCH